MAVFFDETGLRHAGDETGLRHADDETGSAPHGNAGEKRLAVPHEDVAQVVAGSAGELVDGRDGRGPAVGSEVNATLACGNAQLLIDGFHVVEVGQQKAAPTVHRAHDDTVTAAVEGVGAVDGFGRAQDVDIIDQLGQLVGANGREARVSRAGGYGVAADLLGKRAACGTRGTDAASELAILLD